MSAEITYTEHTQIAFRVLTEHGPYCDAIYCEVGAEPSPAELEVIAKERANNWLAIVNTPPVEEPVPEPEYLIITEDGTEVPA